MIDKIVALVDFAVQGLQAIGRGDHFCFMTEDWSMVRLSMFGAWHLSIAGFDRDLIGEAGKWLDSRGYTVIEHQANHGLMLLVRNGR